MTSLLLSQLKKKIHAARPVKDFLRKYLVGLAH